MSEFDKLKDDAAQYAKDHPQQVQKAEQDAEHAVESKTGAGRQGGESQQNDQDDDGQEAG